MAAKEIPATADGRINSFTVFGGSLSKNVDFKDSGGDGVFGTVFSYNHDKSHSVGVVRLIEPMSPILNHFEIEIVETGQQTAIGLGFGNKVYSMAAMPGWNSPSIGYHADDGNLFHSSGAGRRFGPICTKGDVMGCGIDFLTDCGVGYCNVWFTKNGKKVGDGTQRMKRPLHGYYPLIGMHSRGESVRYLGHSYREPECESEQMEFSQTPRTKWMRCNGVRFEDSSVVYDGNSYPDRDVGVAIANFFLTPVLHYFELTIEDPGQNCEVAIGVVCKDYSTTQFPGWQKQSVGYHSDNGELYKESGSGKHFGPKCSAGDIMGCGIKFLQPYYGEEAQVSTSSSVLTEEEAEQPVEDDDDYDSEYDEDDEWIPPPEKFKEVKLKEASTSQRPSCMVYFTKNGSLVGETEMTIPEGGFYPIVGVLSRGEKIAVNLHPLTG